ncbi:MAG: AAA family ATPase [candidate division Zixibacteria bacterium]|nr:AAA family ATPase [candidate division Zixibacteria bacterium]
MTSDDARGGLEAAPDDPAIEQIRLARERIMQEVRKIIVGQDEVIEQVLIALFVGGHCLITGVPGLAKTLLIRTIADILDLEFKRIQFTPDLMPADITGTEILEEDRSSGQRALVFIKGPIFANILLADEINRTPPKTQAALLEAMQEHHVTAGRTTYRLEEPFFVLATQNPIELEGTYPLPEAQLDRFMFNVYIDYLSENDEVEVATATTSAHMATVSKIMDGTEVLRYQQLVRQVLVSEQVARYAVRLAALSRPSTPGAPDYVKNWVTWGAGLRASQYLILGGKARALLDGRSHVSCADIRAMAFPVMRHRILTNFYADAEKIKSDDIVKRLLDAVPQPESGM